MIDCPIEIKHLQLCDLGRPNLLDDRPNKAYIVTHKEVLNFGEGYVYIKVKEDDVQVDDYMNGTLPPELVKIKEYFKSIPLKERIQLLKRLKKSLNKIDKYKL